MVVEFKAVSEYYKVNAVDLFAYVPNGVSDGDVAFAFHGSGRENITMPTPAGWTKLGTDATSQGQSSVIFYKVLSASDAGAEISLPVASAGKHSAFIIVYSGVDPDNPIAGLATPSIRVNEDVISIVSPTYSGSHIAIEFAASKGTAPITWTPPAGFTMRAQEIDSGSGSSLLGIADSTTALTGGGTWTMDSSWRQATVHATWLNPAPESTNPPAFLWDGENEIPAQISVWDGSSEKPISFDIL